MFTPADRSARLEEGLVLERAGHWQEACAFWAICVGEAASDAAFAMRQCSAALRIAEPQIATRALAAARAADSDGTLAEKLDLLEVRVAKLNISQLRIRGTEAFDAGDFETAHQHLEALAVAVPDHPWARAKARIAAGLAPSFAEKMHKERPNVAQRVFLTGCGRSGTWLVMAMLQGFEDIYAAHGEQPLAAFLDLPDTQSTHLVKRLHNAYLHFDRIPADIHVMHIVRHPFDVLISAHLGKSNHITLPRLEGEHASYFAVLEGRPNTCVIRFEDMVRSPDDVQVRVERFLQSRAAHPFRDFHMHADLSTVVVQAMHGLRPLDPATLHRWRGDRQAEAFLQDRLAESDGTLRRFADAFSYDLEI